MKKVLIVLALLLCTVAVFASDNTFNLSVAPYSVQIATSSEKKVATSTYGVGAEFAYKRNIYKGIYGEAGFGWDTFIYSNKDPKALSNVMFFAGVGYEYDFANKWSVEAHLDVADDVLFYDGLASDSVTLRTGLGCGYAFTDKFTATFKVDGTFGFAKKDGIHYVNYRVVPMVGCSYSF